MSEGNGDPMDRLASLEPNPVGMEPRSWRTQTLRDGLSVNNVLEQMNSKVG